MLIDFRQGVVRAPANFLQKNGNSVSLVLPPNEHVIATVADGSTDYLISEKQSITNAWVGPFVANTNYWLYWDIHLVTGQRTFGFTTIEPFDGSVPPSNPANGQHWFDTTNRVMKVFNSTTNRWVRVIRVFAAALIGGAVFTTMGPTAGRFDGSQVGLNIQINAGALVFDNLGGALKKKDGTYFTTEDHAVTGVALSSQIKLGSMQVRAVATQAIPALTVVQFTDFNTIVPATNANIDRVAYGIVEMDIGDGEYANVTMEGVVSNNAWDWSDVGPNTQLFVNQYGELTATETIPRIPIAIVIDKNAIRLCTPAIGVAATGYAGSVGERGYTGSSGSGYVGSKGELGYTGSRGVDGSNGYTGSKGDPGVGFQIAATYASVADLLADTTPAVQAGQFAIIQTADANDPDNARVYLWNNGVWQYITDLSGAQGIQGPVGPAGGIGPQGSTGYTGSAGADGVAGSLGYTGSAGPAGDVGYTGSAGTVGYTGSQGATGPAGAGYTGSAGIGFVGSKGDLGYTGSAGPVGPAGYTGSASTAPGYTGSAGSIGYTGSAGAAGVAGATGFTGSAGAAGPAGTTGATGYTGSASTVAGPVGYTGSAGAGYTGSASTVAGPQGFTGSAGSAGANGAQGYTGSAGADGAAGATGYTGSASTVAGPVGYTGSAGVGYTGSASTVAGPLGYTGSAGTNGYTGSASTVPGPTGFTGSAGVGYTGSAGPAGTAGAQGYTGSQGPAGAGYTGSAGAVGYTGSAGSGGGASVVTRLITISASSRVVISALGSQADLDAVVATVSQTAVANDTLTLSGVAATLKLMSFTYTYDASYTAATAIYLKYPEQTGATSSSTMMYPNMVRGTFTGGVFGGTVTAQMVPTISGGVVTITSSNNATNGAVYHRITVL